MNFRTRILLVGLLFCLSLGLMGSNCEPPPAPQACGLYSDPPCPEGYACDLNGCSPQTRGTCEKLPDRPEGCETYVDEKVCGCNGISYKNKCYLWLSGSAKYSDGSCESLECGTWDDATKCTNGICNVLSCNPGQYGTCVPFRSCPASGLQVCGCDEITYDNDCKREQSGVPKNHDGACEDPTSVVIP